MLGRENPLWGRRDSAGVAWLSAGQMKPRIDGRGILGGGRAGGQWKVVAGGRQIHGIGEPHPGTVPSSAASSQLDPEAKCSPRRIGPSDVRVGLVGKIGPVQVDPE